LNGQWTAHDTRDNVIDFVNRWSGKTDLPASRFVGWLGISSSKFYDWKSRYGKVNEHNAWIPRDHWLDDWEKKAILHFEQQYPLEGYRRLTFMMLDADVVAVSPSSVYRVLKQAGRIAPFNGSPSKKGTGFQHPLRSHEHWHVDVSYLNVGGTFYYLASLLDGYSRSIVHWEIHESMTEPQIEILCAFDEPHLQSDGLTRHHATHLEVSHGFNDNNGYRSRRLAGTSGSAASQRATDSPVVPGEWLP
jgi:putative transposase